ncbi:hypothetical protein CDAR_377561 [Caerostris darwini]|uniref:Maturase K n=1 Tax=Caerostris darwini TaxID=1538125 RepID=A0AAV4U4F2_9ARAC|nr:hypothetical protein CDAR_377561 [Caerostris darwini]
MQKGILKVLKSDALSYAFLGGSRKHPVSSYYPHPHPPLMCFLKEMKAHFRFIKSLQRSLINNPGRVMLNIHESTRTDESHSFPATGREHPCLL